MVATGLSLRKLEARLIPVVAVDTEEKASRPL
jgi:hypothetical protein